MINWTLLETAEQIDEIKKQPGYSIIFKHSTRCSISLMAKKRVEMDGDDIPSDISMYFLDLIKYRDISSKIATDFQVYHESPQLLLIKDGECILDQSHGQISIEEAVTVM
jgi:bacillithiol system protein YtxJ